jgi:hypothetical protein
MDSTDATHIERRLCGALEPVIGSVYFSPECHANYVGLGFDPSPATRGGVALPDGVAYATSRGSLLGDARGSVVAAAFGVFEPHGIAAAADQGWTITDAASILAAREFGAIAQLERILGPDPAGRARVEELLRRAVDGLTIGPRPLAAGAAAAPVTDHPLGPIFRFGDIIREFRGDSHNAAWAAAGLDGTQIGLLTELYWGLPLRSYTRTRGWSVEQFDTAEDELRSRDLIDVNGGFTAAGRAAREAIEVATDRQMASVIRRLEDDTTELIALLSSWGAAVRSAGGYLPSGPHDLAAN